MRNYGYDTVEFMGGPFDGLIERLSDDPELLPEDLICFVSDNLFRLIDGLDERPKIQVTSVAIYERQYRDCEWLYVFVGSISPRTIAPVYAPRSH